MQNNFPLQPLLVALTIKQLHDQVQACKQWISSTAKHSITLIFFVKVNGFDETRLIKLEGAMFSGLSPGTREHLDKFLQALADEQYSKKLFLEHQESGKGVQAANESLNKKK